MADASPKGSFVPSKPFVKRARRELHPLLRCLRVGALAYCVLILIGIFYSERLIFVPHAASYQDGPVIIKLQTADGLSISAVHFQNPKAKYTLLYSHGNAEDLGDNFGELGRLRDQGFSVFAYDYHGYGTSQGSPSEAASLLDIDAAYEYLLAIGVPASRIIVHGRSLGGGPSVDLAARKPVAGLILESCFKSAFTVVTRVPLLPFDRFRNLSKLAQVNCPLLVMHGQRDRVIPFAHGQTLFNQFDGTKRSFWVEQAGHDDLRAVAGDQFIEQLRAFIELVDSGMPEN